MENEVPYIKIGSGTKNFYANLCRAYLKNYSLIRVVGGGYKIYAALWIYAKLQKEFNVHDIQHLCVHYNRMHSMCIFSISKYRTDTVDIIEDNENNIEITENETVSHTVYRCRNILKDKSVMHISAVGIPCVKAFFVSSQLALLGCVSYVYPVKLLQDQVKIKIKVYKPY